MSPVGFDIGRSWMTLLSTLAKAAAFSLVLAGSAMAQTVALGTTQGGATGQIATAIAQIVSLHGGGMQVRPQPVANTAQYIPPINAGQIEFGIANAPQTSNAYNGVGMSQGQAAPNLRMVATLFPFNAGLVSTKASEIKKASDLKGKRLPWFPENSLGDVIMKAMLEVGGVKPDEVTRVPMPNFPRMFDAFKAGQIDTSIVAVGSQNTIDFQQSITGGIRFLTFASADLPTLAKWLPGVSLRVMPVSASNPGIEEGTRIFSYAYTLFTHASMGEDTVYKLVKALADRSADIKATSPLWEEFDTKTLGGSVGVPYHPGAARFFREAGIEIKP
jgi:uncharacterized protein